MRLLLLGLLPHLVLASIGVAPSAAAAADDTTTASGSGTCSSTSKCVSGCCSSSGFCGFGPDYCGKTCISSCDAVAECGQYAATPGTKCPLNVCCSQYGFCGTTSDFCDTGCQSGCMPPTAPSCSAASGQTASGRRIGYYESWSTSLSCNAWYPSDIDATKWTHLNYAFALIDTKTFKIAQMNANDVELYSQFTNLKASNPTLKTFISVGGWAAGGKVFSTMTSTAANRAAFISSLKAFMTTYGFDGVDIDWEYPAAGDRGGVAADTQNFVTLLSELRSALGSSVGITATLPSSYWYMQGFDVVGMEQYVDWFNLMTYDIHGTWDGDNPNTQAVVQPHTNLTEIQESFDLLWRNNIDSTKVVLGLAFYGRSFTLENPSCKAPGCPFSGGGNPGKCTATSGILSDYEIRGIISQYDLTPTLNEEAAVKYMSWATNQWVSYDDADTFKLKMNFANSQCLGGTMVWALDQDTLGTDDSAGDLLLLGGNNIDGIYSVEMKTAVSQANAATAGIFWTPCLPYGTPSACPVGYRPIAWGHGKVFDGELMHLTGEGCHGGGVSGFQRALCVVDNVKYDALQWGPGARSKACNSKCPTGWLTLTKNSHVTGQKSGCKSGKYAPVCVKSMTAISSSRSCPFNPTSQLLSGGLSGQGDLTEDIGYIIQSIESLEGVNNKRSISSVDANSSNAFPNRETGLVVKRSSGGLSSSCGSSLLDLSDIPIDIPGYFKVSCAAAVIAACYWAFQPVSVSTTSTSNKPTRTVYVPTTTTYYSTGSRTCDGTAYPSPCLHYSSVAGLAAQYKTITCAMKWVSDSQRRPLTRDYNDQHNSVWSYYIAKSYINPSGKTTVLRPQRDEWPPAHFLQGTPNGFIRMVPGDQNGGVANKLPGGWNKFCKYPPDHTVTTQGGPINDMGAYYEATIYSSDIYTLNVMDYTWTRLPPLAGDPFGLTANVARPSVLTNDVGWALLTNDPWYGKYGSAINPSTAYLVKPTNTKGVSQPNLKRREQREDGNEDDRLLYNEDINDLIIDDGNSTRRATHEEMDAMGYVRCETRDCEAERQRILEALNAEKAGTLTTAVSDVSSGPITVMAESTGTVEAGTLAAEMRAGVMGEQSQPTPTSV